MNQVVDDGQTPEALAVLKHYLAAAPDRPLDWHIRLKPLGEPTGEGRTRRSYWRTG